MRAAYALMMLSVGPLAVGCARNDESRRGNEGALEASQITTASKGSTRVFRLATCSEKRRESGREISKKLRIDVVTDARKKPVAIKGVYSFTDGFRGRTGSAVFGGAINKRFYDDGIGGWVVTLEDGKIDQTLKGDTMGDEPRSVRKVWAFGFRPIEGSYEAFLAVEEPGQADSQNCTMSNLSLIDAIEQVDSGVSM